MASSPTSASALAGPSNLGASSSSSGSGGATGSNSSTPAALLTPIGNPNDWTSSEVTQWLASLQPPQTAHASSFRSNGITGDVILQLDAEALRDLGVVSVGQRLVLLSAIYKLKLKWGIAIEEGDWTPAANDGTDGAAPAPAVTAALRARDERIHMLEHEVAKLAEYLSRFQHDFASVCRMLNVRNPSSEHPAPSLSTRSDPLLFTPESTLQGLPTGVSSGTPYTDLHAANGVNGTLRGTPESPRKLAPIIATPHEAGAYQGPTSAASFGSGGSGAGVGSGFPNGSTANATSSGAADAEETLGSATTAVVPLAKARTPTSAHSITGAAPHSIARESEISPTRIAPVQEATQSPTTLSPGATPTSAQTPSGSAAIAAASAAAAGAGPRRPSIGNAATTPTSADPRAGSPAGESARAASSTTPSTAAPASGSTTATSSTPGTAVTATTTTTTSSSGSSSGDNPYKSFRVTLDDPCHKVLPAALKKYKIHDDWRQYALFICYGGSSDKNTERCLSYDEKPLLLFQKLKEAKQNPVFMLRHIRDVKSPIAIANAKAAARKASGSRKSGAGGASAANAPPADGEDAGPSSAPSSATAASGSTLRAQQSKAGGKVAEAVARFGGGHSRETSGEGAERGGVATGAAASPTTPGEPVVTGPAAQLENPITPPTFAIAIYPYVSERADEFDVGIGSTFVVLSKAKGWWVVQRDVNGTGSADIVGVRSADEEGGPSAGQVPSGWVPAGCLLETSKPLGTVLSPNAAAGPRAASSMSFATSEGSQGFESAPSTPTTWSANPASLTAASEPPDAVARNAMANAPIPPNVITSTSTPGLMLMDYAAPLDRLDLKKDTKLRVFKRYNHWSYCVAENESHARGWVPSWYIGKVSTGAPRSAAAKKDAADATPTSRTGNEAGAAAAEGAVASSSVALQMAS